MTFKTLAIAAAAFGLAATPAAAVSMNGTLAASMFGISSDTPSIDIGSILGNSGTFVSGSTGDFSSTPLSQPLTVGTFTFTNGNAVGFTSTIGNFTGTLNSVQSDGAPTNRVLSGYALGTFTPEGIFSTFDAGLASLTFSFTQNNAEGAISGGFTLSTPPATVPEPAAWAMLIAGFGLTGAAMRRRGARAVAA